MYFFKCQNAEKKTVAGEIENMLMAPLSHTNLAVVQTHSTEMRTRRHTRAHTQTHAHTDTHTHKCSVRAHLTIMAEDNDMISAVTHTPNPAGGIHSPGSSGAFNHGGGGTGGLQSAT